MKERFNEEVEYFKKTIGLVRDIWDIEGHTIDNAVEILRKSFDREPISKEEIKGINIHPISSFIRRPIVEYLGFVILTTELLDKFAEYLEGKKVLEIMAGCGSFAKGLQDRGIDVIATDNYQWAEHQGSMYKTWEEPWTDVERIDAREALDKYKDEIDVVLLSWPPYKSDIPYKIAEMLREINKDIEFIYIGEDIDGCTASAKFYENTEYVTNPELEKVKKEFIHWDGFEDSINIVKLK